MHLAAPYLLIATYCVTVFEDGGPWLAQPPRASLLLECTQASHHLPVSLAMLIRARLQEAIGHRNAPQ